MSDDLTDKISQISQLLNQEGMADNLKGLFSMFANSMGPNSQEESTEQPQTAQPPQQQQHPQSQPHQQFSQSPPRLTQRQNKDNSSFSSGGNNRSELEQNMEMLRTVQKVMEGMRSNNDPRINLLSAVRPYLNNTRQQKLSNCIRILQLTSITKLMGQDGINSLFK